jgi:peptide/nickel transport system permease protein
MDHELAHRERKRSKAIWASAVLPGTGLMALGERRLGLWLCLPYCIFLAFTVYRWNSVQGAFTSGELEHWVASIFLLVVLLSFWSYSLAKTVRWGKDKGEVGISHWQITKKQFRKNKLAVVGMIVVLVLYAVAFLSPFLAPFDPNAQEDIVRSRYLPPLAEVFSPVVILQDGRRIVAREVQELGDRISYVPLAEGSRENGGQTASQSMTVSRYEVKKITRAMRPRWWNQKVHWLGTDKFGRDILSRIIYGSRISLSIGFVAVGIAITFGTFVGAIAGYYGGRVDNIIMRLVDMILAFPRLFLILTLIALFTPKIWLIIAVLGATGWMGTARLVRGQILSLKEQEFVQAAHALGLSTPRIIFRHILPNAMAPIIVTATLRVGTTILVAAALSFLGLGVQPPTASWGNIINQGRDNLLGAWWIATFPGLAIVLTVVAYNLFGDGLRDALDPRLRD